MENPKLQMFSISWLKPQQNKHQHQVTKKSTTYFQTIKPPKPSAAGAWKLANNRGQDLESCNYSTDKIISTDLHKIKK